MTTKHTLNVKIRETARRLRRLKARIADAETHLDSHYNWLLRQDDATTATDDSLRMLGNRVDHTHTAFRQRLDRHAAQIETNTDHIERNMGIVNRGFTERVAPLEAHRDDTLRRLGQLETSGNGLAITARDHFTTLEHRADGHLERLEHLEDQHPATVEARLAKLEDHTGLTTLNRPPAWEMTGELTITDPDAMRIIFGTDHGLQYPAGYTLHQDTSHFWMTCDTCGATITRTPINDLPTQNYLIRAADTHHHPIPDGSTTYTLPDDTITNYFDRPPEFDTSATETTGTLYLPLEPLTPLIQPYIGEGGITVPHPDTCPSVVMPAGGRLQIHTPEGWVNVVAHDYDLRR